MDLTVTTNDMKRILLYGAIFLCISCMSMEKEKHYFPDGYIGEAYMVFEYEEGSVPIYKDEYRIYEFSGSGKLKTQFEPNFNSIPHYEKDEWAQFYYVDNKGNEAKRLLNYIWMSDSTRLLYQDSVVVFYNINYQTHTKYNEYQFRAMIIDTARNVDKYNFKYLLSGTNQELNEFIK